MLGELSLLRLPALPARWQRSEGRPLRSATEKDVKLTFTDLRRFLAEAVYDLRKSLKSKDSDLLVRFGKMEKIVDQVVESLEGNGDKVKSVYLQKDVSHRVHLQ